jgi:hypothetical protein
MRTAIAPRKTWYVIYYVDKKKKKIPCSSQENATKVGHDKCHEWDRRHFEVTQNTQEFPDTMPKNWGGYK